MKFGEHLLKNRTPEWSTQYIEYNQMKVKLEQIAAQPREYFQQEDDEFFQFCQRQLNKIDVFYAQKLAEVIRLFEPLKQEIANLEVFQNQFQMINGNANAVLNGVVQLKNKRTRQKKLNDLKLAFSELYLLLVLLQNYQTLNATGFRKILKKHDKNFQTNLGDLWCESLNINENDRD